MQGEVKGDALQADHLLNGCGEGVSELGWNGEVCSVAVSEDNEGCVRVANVVDQFGHGVTELTRRNNDDDRDFGGDQRARSMREICGAVAKSGHA